MYMKLTRASDIDEGIFGSLISKDDSINLHTLEHSFEGIPKVAPGMYNVVRHPPNRLPYETFMLENVPDFEGQPVTGILFHIGNFNNDSDGCILLGTDVDIIHGRKAVLHSRDAFGKFMMALQDMESFTLEVV